MHVCIGIYEYIGTHMSETLKHQIAVTTSKMVSTDKIQRIIAKYLHYETHTLFPTQSSQVRSDSAGFKTARTCPTAATVQDAELAPRTRTAETNTAHPSATLGYAWTAA